MIRMVHTLVVVPNTNEQASVNTKQFSLGTTVSREFRELAAFQAAFFFLDITAVSGTSPTIDVTIQTQDPISGKWFTIATFPQQNAVTGATPAATLMQSADPLPGVNFRAQFVVGGSATPTVTCSLSAVTYCEEPIIP